MHSKFKFCFNGGFCSFSGRVLVARLLVPDVWLGAAINGYNDLLHLLVYRYISLIYEHLGHLGRFSKNKFIQNEGKIKCKENEIIKQKVKKK